MDVTEQKYLKYVQNEIQKEITRTEQKMIQHQNNALETKRYLYEAQAQMDLAEKALHRVSIYDSISFAEDAIRQKNRLIKLFQSPYFGRIDFQFSDESETNVYYIGVCGFSEKEANTVLIYDWRAPISSLFYDFELGDAFYTAPSGKIEGKLCLKRQYKISKGNLEYVVESSLAIGDDILQKELSCNSDEKMKNIAATIQKEQNAIIRDQTAKTLIVQGVAGSGKTSIALHRVAFLLYHEKGILNSRNILIVSPNKVFADYISGVLPELGEEDILEMTFDEITADYLENTYKYQTFFQQVESLLSAADPEMSARIAYKSSNRFVEDLQEFIQFAAKHYFVPKEIRCEDFYISEKDVLEIYRQTGDCPIQAKLKKTAERLIFKLEIQAARKIDRETCAFIEDSVRQMYQVSDAFSLYEKFYDYINKKEYFLFGEENVLEYSDVSPLVYVTICYEGIKKKYRAIKHLLIDEMQDYTPVQYKVLSVLFSCRLTILGDSYQSMAPCSSSSAEKILPYFPGAKTIELCKSYRSTFEIMEFARRIINNEKLRPVERHGCIPSIIGANSTEKEISEILQLIYEFKASTFSSLGIICKSQKDAFTMYQLLQNHGISSSLLSFESCSMKQGISITSVHMAKGLEFDQVIIPQVSKINYRTVMDRNLLYIACTRALHKLDLTYSGSISDFLQ